MKPFVAGFILGCVFLHTYDDWSMTYVIAEAQYQLSRLADQKMPAI